MRIAVFAFPDSIEPAARLAHQLGVECRPVAVRHFPDGESLTRVPPASDTALLYRSLDRPNGKIFELLQAADALRDGGVRRLVLVVPYLAYMRQDRAFHPGEAVSQRILGKLLAGQFDALITIDPHLHRIRSLNEIMPGIETVSLSAASVLAPALAGAEAPLLVGPDAESRPWVEALARPAGLEFLLGEKRRDGDRAVEVSLPNARHGAGRRVVLVDDLISSGATLAAAARLLREAGAASIEALATHCVARAGELEQLREAGIASIRATDTVAGPAAVLPVAHLLAQEISRQGWC